MELGIPGAQVNVNERTAAAGVADIVTERPMRPTLAFRAGSVTKELHRDCRLATRRRAPPSPARHG